ncbi:phage major capsid protein [Xylanimonas allomyrinae]|uniref:phage major capsid protein n=1 Tax=Xylanimonas allomyrinae TaxID=2509459 RepID=UPI0013A6149A|nr:phage major capsid protein [Xylanimonas allomyrinae]
MKINTKAGRDAALKTAQRIVDGAKAANRDLTETETATIEQTVADVKAFDEHEVSAEQQERYRKGAELLAYFANDDRPPGEKSGAHLSLKRLADDLTAGMAGYSGRVSPGIKGLVPAGETVIPIPLVNTTPIPGAASLETPPRLVDVLPVEVRQAPVYSVLKQTVVPSAGAASVVAPGDVKPTKKLGVERVDSRLRVLAVLSEPQDKYLLEDAQNLRTWVGSELAEEIQSALEAEVLTGDGTGEHFTGLANTSGVQTQAFVRDPLVTVQYGLSKLANLGIAPSFVALSAADWLAIQTTRNASGTFDVGGPIDSTNQTAWGTRVVVVPGLAEGVGYVVGAESLTLSTDNHGVRAEWGNPGDTFTRNQVVARVEGRFNLDVMRPHGIVKLSLAES